MTLKFTLTAMAAVLALAGCGNQPDRGQFLKAITSGVLKKKAPAVDPAQTQAAIAAELAGSDRPLTLATIESRKAVALITRIETNGSYETWAAPDRRTLVLRGGMVTASRGLGNDIMSSDTAAVAALIAARKDGQAVRVQRYLDGENHTVELVAECTVTRGGKKQVTAGVIKAQTTEMVENCDAEGRTFTNSYLVDGHGYPVQSRQWLSPGSGYVTLQALRR